MTERDVGGTPYLLEYTAENKLSSVTQGGTTLVSYTYDGDGNLTHKTDGVRNTLYVNNLFEVNRAANDRALQFDGVDDNITIPDSPSNGDFSTEITLEAWIKPDGYGDQFSCIVTKGGAYYLNLDTSGHLQFYWYYLSTPGYHKSPNVIPTDEWTHVAATYDGSYVRLYENGQQVYSASVSGNGRMTSYEVGIGRYPRDTNPIRHFDGYINEVRILNQALDANEIQEDFDVYGHYPERPGTVGWYHLDEASGTAVIDASSYNNDGTINNGASWSMGLSGHVFQYYYLGDERVALRTVEITDVYPQNNIWCDDYATGSGYLMYSEENLLERFSDYPPRHKHIVCVKYSQSGWMYDYRNTYYPFTPNATDVLIAETDYSYDTVTDLKGVDETYQGITKGYRTGDLTFYADRISTGYNNGEFYVTGSYFVPHDAEDVLTYLHTDHLGSASLSTSATGGVASEMRYYPYGETRSGTMDTDRLYTGQRWEVGIGLYDYNARYYDPALGRFVQADTIVPNPKNPQEFNRYSYVLNNSLKHTDATGHMTEWDWQNRWYNAHGYFWDPSTGFWSTVGDPVFSDVGIAREVIGEAGITLGGNATWTDDNIKQVAFGVAKLGQRLSGGIPAIKTLTGGGVEVQLKKKVAFGSGSWAPPPSISNGRLVKLSEYMMNNSIEIGAQYFIHELGHVIDWQNGFSSAWNDKYDGLTEYARNAPNVPIFYRRKWDVWAEAVTVFTFGYYDSNGGYISEYHPDEMRQLTPDQLAVQMQDMRTILEGW
jgi:RHS repeat-associated protein